MNTLRDTMARLVAERDEARRQVDALLAMLGRLEQHLAEATAPRRGRPGRTMVLTDAARRALAKAAR